MNKKEIYQKLLASGISHEELRKFIIDYAVANYKECVSGVALTGTTIVDSETRFNRWLNDYKI